MLTKELLESTCLGPLIAMDAHGSLIHWSEGARQIFGWSGEEVLRRPPPFLAGRALGGFKERCEAVLRSGKSAIVELPGHTRDGAQTRVRVHLCPVRGTQAVAAMIEPIPPLEQPGTLALRRLMDANVVGMIVSDLQGRIFQANDRFLQMVGRTREDLAAGRVRWDEMTPPEHKPRSAEAVRVLRKEGRFFPFEKEYLRPDGSRVPVLLAGASLDEISGEVLTVVLDQSQSRRAEDALRASEERFRTLSASAPVGIFEMDAQGSCTYVNPRWSDITGFRAEQGLGVGWLQTLRPEDREAVRLDWERNRREPQERVVEIPLVRPSGELRWASLRVSPVFTPARALAGFVGTIEDITDRVEAERERARLLERERQALAQAQEAARAKDQFIAVLSHELRNPLAPIAASIELLKRTVPQDPRTARVLEVLERNVRLESRLVNDLLDLSRVLRGKVQLQRAPIALDEVVRAAVQAVRVDLDGAGLLLEDDLESGLWVQGDFDRLQQVVMNLLSNAIKFTPRGGRVRVRLERAGERAHLVVEDTGIGIDEALLPRLFAMFQQGEIAGPRKPGLGIGLALVRSIIEMHGGAARAESAGPGRGSIFTVELPLVEAPAGRDAAVARPGGRGAVVLLVEDNPDTRAMLAEALEVLGYRVHSADCGERALDDLRRVRPDFILADIGLPGMDGYEFLRRARAGAPDVPAFAITGYGQPEDFKKAQAAGFAGHFVKPVDLEVLDRRMSEHLGRTRA